MLSTSSFHTMVVLTMPLMTTLSKFFPVSLHITESTRTASLAAEFHTGSRWTDIAEKGFFFTLNTFYVSHIKKTTTNLRVSDITAHYETMIQSRERKTLIIMMLIPTSMISAHVQTGGVLQAQQCVRSSSLTHLLTDILFVLKNVCTFSVT